LAPLAKRIAAAFVFGSAARGELQTTSDIDLFVIGDVAFAEVANALAAAQRQVGRDINPTVYPVSEVRAKLRSKQHFVTSILNERRIYVIGNDDELERLAGEQMAR